MTQAADASISVLHHMCKRRKVRNHGKRIAEVHGGVRGEVRRRRPLEGGIEPVNENGGFSCIVGTKKRPSLLTSQSDLTDSHSAIDAST